MNKMLFNILNELGIPHNVKGRAYIETSVKIVLEKGFIPVTKELYPAVAKEHNTTSSRVERAIRHAIERGHLDADIDAIFKYFGNTIPAQSGKLSNSSFIYGVAKYLELFAAE